MDETSPRSLTSFPPKVMEAIYRAYTEACDIAGVHRVEELRGDKLRRKLAEHIMDLAREGETDEHRLCSVAVLAVIGRTADHNSPEDTGALPDPRKGSSPPAAVPGATGTGDTAQRHFDW